MSPNRGPEVPGLEELITWLDDDDLRKVVALAAQRYEDVARAVRLAASRAGANLGRLRAESEQSRGAVARRLRARKHSAPTSHAGRSTSPPISTAAAPWSGRGTCAVRPAGRSSRVKLAMCVNAGGKPSPLHEPRRRLGGLNTPTPRSTGLTSLPRSLPG